MELTIGSTKLPIYSQIQKGQLCTAHKTVYSVLCLAFWLPVLLQQALGDSVYIRPGRATKSSIQEFAVN